MQNNPARPSLSRRERVRARGIPEGRCLLLRAALVALAVARALPAPADQCASGAVSDSVPLLVTVSQYEFSPGGPSGPPIRLQSGVTYRITFRSIDVEHGVSAIPALGIEGGSVSPGTDYVVTVTPTALQVGRYNFACTHVCGPGHGGMHGSIEVEAGADDPTVLRLGAGRFKVRVAWSSSSLGSSGDGQAISLTADTGAFWFFQPTNVELVVKILDGRGINGHFWIFYGALSNVEYTITVTDTVTGAVREYHNPEGNLASGADTTAF